MSRFKLLIVYDGTKYQGWQIQKDGRTVQGVIENAFIDLSEFDERIQVNGSGRTDAGVHALGQVAHVDFHTNLDMQTFKNALNAKLPEDCRIISIEQVNKDFHSRYDAKKRYYRYQCYEGCSLLYRNQCWIVKNIDMLSLNEIASYLIGNHDFLSFCKYRKELENTVCEIFESRWLVENNMIIYKISANRFLHHMIRYLVGTMVGVCQGRISSKYFKSLLKNPRKDVQILKAPPQGLFLEKIKYE